MDWSFGHSNCLQYYTTKNAFIQILKRQKFSLTYQVYDQNFPKVRDDLVVVQFTVHGGGHFEWWTLLCTHASSCHFWHFHATSNQQFQFWKQQNVDSLFKYDKWQVGIETYFVDKDGPINLRPPRLWSRHIWLQHTILYSVQNLVLLYKYISHTTIVYQSPIKIIAFDSSILCLAIVVEFVTKYLQLNP